MGASEQRRDGKKNEIGKKKKKKKNLPSSSSYLAVPRHERVGVHAEPFHVPVVERDAHVVQQEGEHVHGLRVVREEVGDAPPFLLLF